MVRKKNFFNVKTIVFILIGMMLMMTVQASAAQKRAKKGLRIGIVAEMLGIEKSELKDALKEGATIEEVAVAYEVELQIIFDALMVKKQARIDKALEKGKITEIFEFQSPEGLIDPPGIPSPITYRLTGFNWF